MSDLAIVAVVGLIASMFSVIAVTAFVFGRQAVVRVKSKVGEIDFFGGKSSGSERRRKR